MEDDAALTPLPIDDEISSLSAILLNEAYYELLKTGQIVVDGIPVLSPICLIPFKAKAWLELRERKSNGGQVDSKNIKKHKNDIFRKCSNGAVYKIRYKICKTLIVPVTCGRIQQSKVADTALFCCTIFRYQLHHFHECHQGAWPAGRQGGLCCD